MSAGGGEPIGGSPPGTGAAVAVDANFVAALAVESSTWRARDAEFRAEAEAARQRVRDAELELQMHRTAAAHSTALPLIHDLRGLAANAHTASMDAEELRLMRASRLALNAMLARSDDEEVERAARICRLLLVSPVAPVVATPAPKPRAKRKAKAKAKTADGDLSDEILYTPSAKRRPRQREAIVSAIAKARLRRGGGGGGQ